MGGPFDTPPGRLRVKQDTTALYILHLFSEIVVFIINL